MSWLNWEPRERKLKPLFTPLLTQVSSRCSAGSLHSIRVSFQSKFEFESAESFKRLGHFAKMYMSLEWFGPLHRASAVQNKKRFYLSLIKGETQTQQGMMMILTDNFFDIWLSHPS